MSGNVQRNTLKSLQKAWRVTAQDQFVKNTRKSGGNRWWLKCFAQCMKLKKQINNHYCLECVQTFYLLGLNSADFC